MKMKIYKCKNRSWTIVVKEKSIFLLSNEHKFSINYPFLNEKTGYLTDVEEIYFDLMMYILLYNLDEFELSPPGEKLKSGKTIASYSGGVDSTALLYLTKAIPVHIVRSYDLDYENRQIRACESAGALKIITDVEKIRELYIGRHGFNIGTGYSSVYIPVLPLLKASKIAFGVVFDDLAFHYGKIFKFNNSFHNTGLYRVKSKLAEYGIDIICPLAGYSEVLTVKMAIDSGIKGFSSCHSVGGDDSCRACYKCFRKQAIMGKPLDIDQPEIRKMVFAFLGKQPLKMAASTVYAIQKAKYKDPRLERFMDIDVSWCERVNKSLTDQFGGFNDNYRWQNEKDQQKIQEFVKIMNNPKMYVYE